MFKAFFIKSSSEIFKFRALFNNSNENEFLSLASLTPHTLSVSVFLLQDGQIKQF